MRLLFLAIFFLMAQASYAQSAVVVTGTGSKVSEKEAKEFLEHHNLARKEVGVPPLTWSAEISAYAQKWAEYLATEKNGDLYHRSELGKRDKNYGENLFFCSPSRTVVEASKSWYSEKNDYTYGKVGEEKSGAVVGHYTQMVWKNSTAVGVGVAYTSNGGMIVVANYNPPGNYIGQYPY